jgi:hypothetical protein
MRFSVEKALELKMALMTLAFMNKNYCHGLKAKVLNLIVLFRVKLIQVDSLSLKKILGDG